MGAKRSCVYTFLLVRHPAFHIDAVIKLFAVILAVLFLGPNAVSGQHSLVNHGEHYGMKYVVHKDQNPGVHDEINPGQKQGMRHGHRAGMSNQVGRIQNNGMRHGRNRQAPGSDHVGTHQLDASSATGHAASICVDIACDLCTVDPAFHAPQQHCADCLISLPANTNTVPSSIRVDFVRKIDRGRARQIQVESVCESASVRSHAAPSDSPPAILRL